jgi:hypothetical protein
MDYKNKLKDLKWVSSYVEYIRLKGSGLKKDASKAMSDFIDEFQNQSKQSRRLFIEQVNQLAYDTNDYHTYLPMNLYSLIKGELEDWSSEEPNNPIPLIWKRDLTTLKEAIAIDPTNEIAVELLGTMILNKVSMNQHELSSGGIYDGDAQEDIALIDFYLNHISHLTSNQKREELTLMLTDLKSEAKAWV